MQKIFFLVLFGFIALVVIAGNTGTKVPSVTPSFSQATPAAITTPARVIPPAPESKFNNATTSYTCDGRQYCSQMNSRAEAVFFIKNCPNTLMDGDNDGIPCENDSRFK